MVADKKNSQDDFGAIDDPSEDFGAIDDIGAIDDPGGSDVNPLEIQAKIEEDRKAQAAQAAAMQQNLLQQQQNDPSNWTLEQTKEMIKQNPAKTPQEEAVHNVILKTKKEQVKQIEDALSGKPPQKQQYLKAAPPKNVFSSIGDKINNVLGDMGIIESPEFRIAKAMNVKAIAEANGLDPEEVNRNYDAYIHNPQFTGIKQSFGYKTPAEGGGPLRNTEAVLNSIMTPAVLVGAVLTPEVTIPALMIMTGVHEVGELAGIGKAIEESKLTPEAKAGVRILRMVGEGVVGGAGGIPTGKVLTEKIPALKKYSDFWGGILGKTPKDTAEEAAPAAKVTEETATPKAEAPVVDKAVQMKQFQATVVSELQKNNQNRTLTPEEVKAQQWTLDNPEKARDNYIRRSVEEFGSDNIVSADVGKFAIDDAASGLKMTSARSADFHEAGSAISKAREAELLADTSTKDLPTAFTAGGSGSGKSSILRTISKENGGTLKSDYGLVYDTNSNNYASAVSKIQKNLDGGRDVEITYVYRDPLKAWSEGVIPRVKTQDRIVPIKDHINTHRGSLIAVRQIERKFQNDPKVSFTVVDNSFAKGKAKELANLDKVPEFDYTNIGDKLYDLTKQAYQRGEITREDFATAVKGSPKLEERFQKEPDLPVPEVPASGNIPPGQEPAASGLAEQFTSSRLFEEAKKYQTVDDFINSQKVDLINKLYDQIRSSYAEYLPPGTSEKIIDGTAQFFFKNLGDNKSLAKMLSSNNIATRKIFKDLTGLTVGKDITRQQIADNPGKLIGDLVKIDLPALNRIWNEAHKSQELPSQEVIPQGKRRKFIQTVKSSEKTATEVATEIESRYNPISNKETLAAAQERVKTDYNGAIEEVMGPAKPTAESNATAIVLIDKAQSEGRFADAIALVERTAEKQTEYGQAIQALSMYNRLTPEGILMYANKIVRQARQGIRQKERLTQFEKIKKGLNDADTSKLADKLGIPHISEIVAGELRNMAEKIQKMPEGREKEIQTALMLKRIADLIPRDFWDKVSMTQTLAQLLNPKTFVRNFLGNVAFQTLENLSDTVAASIDVATALRTKERSVRLPSIPAQVSGFAKGLKEGTRESLLGVNTKESTSKFTLPKNGVFDKGVMGGLEKTLRLSLGATDRAFYQSAFNQSIRDQMLTAKEKGLNLTEPTAEMVERAHALGMYRTFQDDNVISNQFVTLKKWLNVNKKFGLGDVILKYPKTPGNILARGIEYSPFGFIKSVYELSKPLMGEEFRQEAFVRSTARALTGSATLIGTGALLASLGIISGKRSRDRDVEAARGEVGLRSYQVNVSALKRFMMSGFDPEQTAIREDDLLVSYDWMQPAAIGLAIGANMVLDPKTNLVDKTLNFAEQAASASETLQEQPLVQGVKRFAEHPNVAEAFTSAGQEIPASFVPTILNQIRQLTDNTARNTRDPNYFREAYNKAVMRIPLAAGTLPPQVTARGKDKEIYQLGSNNPFNVFLNPAFVNKYKPDPVSKMVLDIWEMSGETVQFPRVASAKIKLGSAKEPIELTAEKYTEFQRYIGNKTDVLFTILADSPEFLAMDNEYKAKKLQGFLTDINTAAKIEVLGYQPKRVPDDVIAIIKAIGNNVKEINALDDSELGAVEEK